MKTNKMKKMLLTLFSFVLLVSLVFVSAFTLTGKTRSVTADEIPNINLDSVASPVSGRTSWANSSRPLGFVIYLNGVSFATGNTNVHLQNGMTAESLAKITFTRENKSATPALICAGSDGGYSSKSFFAFFFAGALASEEVNTYQEGDTVEIAAGCILKCAEGSFNVPQRLRYEYDGSSWVFVREEKVWNVSGVSTSAWVHPTARPLGVDIYRSAEDRTAEPLDQKTDILTRVNDSTKVTYTRNGVSENPVIIIGTNAYVAYCFKGDVIGATDTTPQNGDLFTIETGFKFRYYNTAIDYNRYYSVKLQYEYFNGTWKACTYTGTATWADSGVDGAKSPYSGSSGMGVRLFCSDKTIAAAQTDGIQNTVFDLTKMTYYRRGSQFHPTRIIGVYYYMNCLFGGISNTETFASGDMLVIEEGFSFIYNGLRYTYAEEERYVFTGSSWQVPSLYGSLKSMNVKLNENINAEFTCTLPVDNFDEGETRLYLTVSGEQTTTLINSGMETKREDGNVFFKVPVKLDPTLLTADIQFYFRWTSGGTAKFSKVFHKTVKDYCDYIIDHGSSAQIDLVKALLNYGGYAQTYFGVNTGNLANDGLYDGDDPIDSVNVEDTLVQSGSATGLTVNSQQLFLETTPTMRLYFTLNGVSLIGEYSFKLMINEKAYNLTPDYDEEAEKYYVDVADIPAKYIGTRFTVEIKNTTDSSVYTIESSVYCYIRTALANGNTSEAKVNMLKALYVYGTCAYAFAN